MKTKVEIIEDIKKFIEDTSGAKIREADTKSTYIVQLGKIDPLSTGFNKETYRIENNQEPEEVEYKFVSFTNLLQMYASVLTDMDGSEEDVKEWLRLTEEA